MAVTFRELDTGSTIQVTCKDQDGVAINLTGATVHLIWQLDEDMPRAALMTLTDAANGIASYQFTATDLPHSGTMNVQVRITDSGGDVITSIDTITYEVGTRVRQT